MNANRNMVNIDRNSSLPFGVSLRQVLVGRAILILCVVTTLSGCAVFRAVGKTVEAVGEGTATVVRGVADGVGTIVGGTGRAVTGSASGKSGDVKGAAQETTDGFSF